MAVSFGIGVRLTSEEIAAAGNASDYETPIINPCDSLRESERLAFAALHEWRAAMSRGTGRPHARRKAIFERDGWECALCGGMIDRALRKGNALCATIDHIIPVSAGGLTVRDNLQAAHAICNHVRGDLPANLVDKQLFAEVRDGYLRWQDAQRRFRYAAKRLERARGRFERRCRAARSGKPSGLITEFAILYRRPIAVA